MVESKKILIIDDEPDFVDSLKNLLFARGFDILTASNGQEGLETLKKTSPDLIILDVTMPKMSGFEFYNRICNEKGQSQVPTLVVSAREELRDAFQGLNVSGFLSKPIRFEEIYKEINAIFSQARALAPEDLTPALRQPASKNWKSLLLVDDDTEFINRAAEVFQERGFLVNWTPVGMEAVSRAMSEHPDVVLINLGLKDMAGDIVAYELKLMPDTAPIPLVLYSRAPQELDPVITEKICRKVGVKEVLLAFDNDPKNLWSETENILKKHLSR